MAEGVLLSKRDHEELKNLLREFRHSRSRQEFRRRNAGRVTAINGVRRAKIQSIEEASLTAKIINPEGETSGDDITVYPVEHLGSNDLDGDVWPDYSANDVIAVFQDVNGNWYTMLPFDDTDEC